jgi:outer membrane protein assembly factor BamB
LPSHEAFVVSGSLGDDPPGAALTIAYDARTGDRIWEAPLPFRASDLVFVTGAAVSNDERHVYIGGSGAFNRIGNDYFLLKYGAGTGNLAWKRIVDDGYDIASDLAVDPSRDRIYLAGTSEPLSSDGSRTHASVIAYSGAGRRLWTYRSTPETERLGDEANSVVVDPRSDSLFWVGVELPSPPPDDRSSKSWLRVVRLDFETGTEVWRSPIPLSGAPLSIATEASLSSEGRSLYVVGAQVYRGTEASDAFTAMFRVEDGEISWIRRSGRPRRGKGGFSVRVRPHHQTVIVAGSEEATSGAVSLFFDGYSASSGRHIVSRRFNTSPTWRDTGVFGDLTVGADGQMVFLIGNGMPDTIDPVMNMVVAAYRT